MGLKQPRTESNPHCGVIPKPDVACQRENILSYINCSKEEHGQFLRKGRSAAFLLIRNGRPMSGCCQFAGDGTGRSVTPEWESFGKHKGPKLCDTNSVFQTPGF